MRIAVILALALSSAAFSAAQANTATTGAEPVKPNMSRNDPGFIRCRKIEETGSLVKKHKVCKTNAEWRRITDSGNRTARDIVESGMACAGGPSCNAN